MSVIVRTANERGSHVLLKGAPEVVRDLVCTRAQKCTTVSTLRAQNRTCYQIEPLDPYVDS
eukprot:531284-Rhodomonas_salina.1